MRIGIGIPDGFVHSKDPPETHSLDLLVGERLTDEAGDFGVRCFELALGRVGTNLLGDPIVVLEEYALEDGDFGRHARGWLEVRGKEQDLGVVHDPEAFLLKTPNPLFTGRSIAHDREVDDAVLLAPGALRFCNRGFATEELQRFIMATEFLDDGVQLSSRKVGRFEFSAHGTHFLLLCPYLGGFVSLYAEEAL